MTSAFLVSHTTEESLKKLTERLELLKGKFRAFAIREDIFMNEANVEKHNSPENRRKDKSTVSDKLQTKTRGQYLNGLTLRSQVLIYSTVKRGPGLPWSFEESRDLPGWFESHRHLSKKEIEQEYLAFSKTRRSYHSIQSQMYKLGLGKMTNKRKETARKHATSEPSLAEHSFVPNFTLISRESPKPSQAMAVIATSNSRPGTHETETENGKVPKARSIESTSTQKPNRPSVGLSRRISSSSNATITDELENRTSESLLSGELGSLPLRHDQSQLEVAQNIFSGKSLLQFQSRAKYASM